MCLGGNHFVAPQPPPDLMAANIPRKADPETQLMTRANSPHSLTIRNIMKVLYYCNEGQLKSSTFSWIPEILYISRFY